MKNCFVGRGKSTGTFIHLIQKCKNWLGLSTSIEWESIQRIIRSVRWGTVFCQTQLNECYCPSTEISGKTQRTVAGSLVSKDKTAGEKSIYEEDEVEIMEKWFLQHREMILENHLLSQMVNRKIDKHGGWRMVLVTVTSVCGWKG